MTREKILKQTPCKWMGLAAIGLIGAALAPIHSHAQCQTLKWTLTASGAGSLGGSVAVSGNNILVGARATSSGAQRAGAAYLFDALDGSLIRTFPNPSPAEFDFFGVAVAISGDRIVVGAPNDDTGFLDSGTAYVFHAGTGTLLQSFFNPSPKTADFFGSAVAISGDDVLVAAAGDDTGATDAGVVHHFNAATGELVRTIQNPTPGDFESFGTLAIAGDKILVGVAWDDTGANDAGSAYLFDRATGSLLRTINNPAPEGGDGFGLSVAISENRALVGAYSDSGEAADAGRAYLFDAETGDLLQTFNKPSAAVKDQFGLSVALSGNNALVGANDILDGANHRPGSAHLFDTVSGALLRSFDTPEAGGDVFGYSVAILNDLVVVGDYSNNSAYVFACSSARGQILDYLLGRGSDPAGLDANGDGPVDIADLILAAE